MPPQILFFLVLRFSTLNSFLSNIITQTVFLINIKIDTNFVENQVKLCKSVVIALSLSFLRKQVASFAQATFSKLFMVPGFRRDNV